MRCAICLLLGCWLAPQAWACKCASPLPQPVPTCQGVSVLSETSGFIAEVLTAESMQDRLEQILRQLPPAAAARARLLLQNSEQSDLTAEESSALSQLLEPLIDRPLRFRLRIIESRDPRFHGELEVLTDFSDCGLPLRQGEVWHLDPQPDNQANLHISFCGGNRKLLFPASERTHLQAARQGSQASRLEGTVTRKKSGAPLANIRVEVRGANETWSATTNAAGAYEFPLLPPGPYQLSVILSGKPLTQQTLHLCPASRHPHHFSITTTSGL